MSTLDLSTHRIRSRQIASNQSSVHRDLVSVVQRHRRTTYLCPIAAHSKTSFAQTDRLVSNFRGPLILDSGCGNGESSRSLARAYPDHLVIGIDKSAVRIKRADEHTVSANLHFVRGDCRDFWRLAAAARWPVKRHFLLYPNPWPKAKHLRRRWHGHAVFDSLITLGGLLELRSNWDVYVVEFSTALSVFGVKNGGVQAYLPNAAMSPFERKYLASGHRLYRLSAQLDSIRP